jgi:hypothetical protein
MLLEDFCEMVRLQTFDTEDLHLLQLLVEVYNDINPRPKMFLMMSTMTLVLQYMNHHGRTMMVCAKE